MKKKTVWVAAGLLLAAVLALASCSSDTSDTPAGNGGGAVTGDGAPKYGGTLKMLGYDATAWDHVLSGQLEYSQLVSSRLITLDWWKGPAGTNEWPFSLSATMPPADIRLGDLAESWEVTSPTSVVYHLKQGVMWQDKPGVMEAREVVAQDIIHNFTRMTTLATHSMGNPYSALKMVSMTAIDDYTVEFVYNAANYWWPYQTIGMSYDMIPPEVVDEFGDMTDWRNVTGSGPFALTDYVSGSVMEYERNPNWHMKDPEGRSLPYIDGMDILVIGDPATMMTAMRSGQVDIVLGYAPIGWAQAEELWETSPELNWVKKTSGQLIKIEFDMKAPPFGPNGDPDALKIRRAASMAIDRVAIVEGYEQGHGQILTSFMAPIFGVEELKLENLPPSSRELFEYNPDEARRLLAEAGRPTIKTKLQYPAYLGDYFSIIKDYWDAVGIETEMKPLDMGALAAIQYSHEMTDVLQSFGGLTMASGAAHLWHMGTEEDGDEGVRRAPMSFNMNSSYDPEITRINSIMNEVEDAVERLALATEATLIEISQVFEIIMPNSDAYNFWQPWVRGYSGEDHVSMYAPRMVAAYVWLDDDYR